MVEEINHDRRRFLAIAMMTTVSAQFGIGPAAAQSSKPHLQLCRRSKRERTSRSAV